MPGRRVRSSDLLSATWEGRSDIVQELLDTGADINSKGTEGTTALVTALMFAAMNGYTKIVQMLLNKGADVNAKDKEGYTALKFAQEINCRNIIELLREAGARS